MDDTEIDLMTRQKIDQAHIWHIELTGTKPAEEAEPIYSRTTCWSTRSCGNKKGSSLCGFQHFDTAWKDHAMSDEKQGHGYYKKMELSSHWMFLALLPSNRGRHVGRSSAPSCSCFVIHRPVLVCHR